MSNNDSSAVTAMHKTLMSIQHIRNLLAQESQNMSAEVYGRVDQLLETLEFSLSQKMAEYGNYQYTQAPNLYMDDEEENANLLRSLFAWAGQNH